jgi:hypothetical protein
MNNVDRLHISFGLVKQASPRWAKVLASIPKEADKISWLRNFIPKNVGTYSVNPSSAYGIQPRAYSILSADVAKELVKSDVSSASLLDKFKSLHRYTLSNKNLIKPDRRDIGRGDAQRAGVSWLRAHNKFFPSEKLGPNDLVPFSHGGGLSHITNFLKGNGGYHTDSGVKGIMITPHGLSASRDMFYATRNAPKTLDTPAVLSGYVPAKYLKNSMNTGYEASLPSKYFDKVVDKKVKNLEGSDVYNAVHNHSVYVPKPHYERSLLDWEKFKERVSRADSLDSFNIISKL